MRCWKSIATRLDRTARRSSCRWKSQKFLDRMKTWEEGARVAFIDNLARLPLPFPPSAGLAPPPPPTFYDVKLKRCIKSGQLRCASVPPEDFLLDPNALKVEERAGRFFADKTRMMRSEAKLKWPKKKAIIDKLPGYTTANDAGLEKQSRDTRAWWWREVVTDKESEEIEILEAFIQVDYDGDGTTEWRKVCVGGGSVSEDSVLANEEWAGPIPYVSV